MKLEHRFTYGFEIEGVFRTTLCRSLADLTAKGLKLEFKNDGSVNIDPPNGNFINTVEEIEISNKANEDLIKWGENEEDEYVREITIGVFKGLRSMVQVLKLFTNRIDYLSSEKCGLHIHIRPKAPFQKQWNKILSLALIQDLQDYAFSQLCQEIKARKTNEYCCPYPKNISQVHFDMFKDYSKYRFMRNHRENGTLEFRFFSACEHKEENVVKFFRYFFKRLKAESHKREATYDLPDIHSTKQLNVATIPLQNSFGMTINHQVRTEPSDDIGLTFRGDIIEGRDRPPVSSEQISDELSERRNQAMIDSRLVEFMEDEPRQTRDGNVLITDAEEPSSTAPQITTSGITRDDLESLREEARRISQQGQAENMLEERARRLAEIRVLRPNRDPESNLPSPF